MDLRPLARTLVKGLLREAVVHHGFDRVGTAEAKEAPVSVRPCSRGRGSVVLVRASKTQTVLEMDLRFLAKHLVDMHIGAALASVASHTPAAPEDRLVVFPPEGRMVVVGPTEYPRPFSPFLPVHLIVENHSGTQIPPELGFVDLPVEPGSPISPTSNGTRKSAPRKVPASVRASNAVPFVGSAVYHILCDRILRLA